MSREKKPDPDETVTYVREPLRGARVLCVVAGIALVVQHVLTGLLATPFFGADAFLWANVLGAFVISLGIGTGFGDRLGALAGKAASRPFRLAALGGGLVFLATWALPHVARAVLDRGPDSPFAAAATFALVLAIPGTVLASIVPCVIGELALEAKERPLSVARVALRRFALAMLGGVGGLAVASFVLRRAEARVDAWLYALASALVLLGLVGLGMVGRIVGAALLAGLAGLVFWKPNELETPEFRAALQDVVNLRGPGRYYASKAEPHVLTGTELERRLEIARQKLKSSDRKIAVLLCVETLKTMGPLNLSGSGLKSLLDIYLPETSKPLILPFVDAIDAVHSDGRRFHFKIRRDGKDGFAHFRLPTKVPEKFQEFTITDDFDMTVVVEGKNEGTTRLDIGPRRWEAGVLNDTTKTPFICNDVALGFVDAWLHSLIVENGEKQVTLSVQAQANVGKVQTSILQIVEK